MLALASALLVAAAPAGERPETAPPAAASRVDSADPAELIWLGLESIQARDYPSGMRALQAAALSSSDPALAGLAWYDLGVAALESGDLERARDAFFDALALMPLDREARFNLEWTLDAMRRRPPPAELPQTPATPEAPMPPAPDTGADTPAAETHAGPPPIDEAEQRRILLQVDDDLRRALLSAVRDGPRKSRHTRSAW
jgi:tetratricopeptide (TPR) repeat protein